MHINLPALLTFLSLCSLSANAQVIPNPSFEGQPMQGMAPLPWQACNPYSSPDTQPGAWNVSAPPSHGNSYLGLVTRGNLGPYANYNEAVQVSLTPFLEHDRTYELSIDLAFSITHGHTIDDGTFLSYANPVVLKIFGDFVVCGKRELLWQSPPIDHTDWRTYNFTITPQQATYYYFILEADHVAPPTYFGNILIDNIQDNTPPVITPVPDTLCTVKSINIFTPNGDGKNDRFFFRSYGTLYERKLVIFNRWGKPVFETDNLREGWNGESNGEKCPAGVYFWHLEYRCLKGPDLTRFVEKGHVTLLD